MKLNPLKDVPPIQMAPTCVLERLCYDESGGTYTLNRLTGKAGSTTKLHSHPHRQVEYILSGRGEFQLGEEKVILSAGDTLPIEPNVQHAFTYFMEDTVFLEFFTPVREDFIPKETE